MSFKNTQKEFDEVKWYDSILAGEDRCGSYEFCGKCDKEEKYPCARAEYKHNMRYIRVGMLRRHK